MAALARIIPDSYRQFIRSWFDAPFAVGAVAPSGRPLARLMTRELEPGQRIVELGPGTGIVTRAILERGIAPGDLYAVERCQRFASLLETQFAGVNVLTGDATDPQPALAALEGRVDFIVSGLPLTLFSRAQKSRLVANAARLLGERGALIQFTYAVRCPIDRRLLEPHGLVARCIGFIALNMPPAFVYRIARRAPDDRRGR